MFRDEAHISVRSGKGGNGCVSFRREKYIPRGGPDGGDGGGGGSVRIVVDADITSLSGIRNHSLVKAGGGGDGTSRKRFGRKGRDAKIFVPPGVRVFDDGLGELVVDLMNVGEECLICQGGGGGKGNVHYATARNQAPRQFEPGKPAEEKAIYLDYRIPADMAAIGLPSSGKTFLLARLSGMKGESGGDFPYSTSSPHLRVAQISPYQSARLLDMPSIEAGSSAGLGPGGRHCRHLLRPGWILAALDSTRYDIPLPKQAEILGEEASKCSGIDVEREKKWVFAVTKREGAPDASRIKKEIRALKKKGAPVVETDARENRGIEELRAFLGEALEEE